MVYTVWTVLLTIDMRNDQNVFNWIKIFQLNIILLNNQWSIEWMAFTKKNKYIKQIQIKKNGTTQHRDASFATSHDFKSVYILGVHIIQIKL